MSERLAPQPELDAQEVIYRLRAVLYLTATQLQAVGGMSPGQKDTVNGALRASYTLARTNVQPFMRRYVEPWDGER